jgi:hypothetical protein
MEALPHRREREGALNLASFGGAAISASTPPLDGAMPWRLDISPIQHYPRNAVDFGRAGRVGQGFRSAANGTRNSCHINGLFRVWVSPQVEKI